jgi:hypothetical protein
MQEMRESAASPHLGAAPLFLHIGAMKTGTTFLQHLLIDNRDKLAAAGYLFPGTSWKDQVRAAQDVLATSDDPVIRTEAEDAWPSLVRELRAHDGAASIVSMEFLSHAAPERVQWAFEQLGDVDVHVVITVRDATAIIPAQWQTSVRSGSTASWPTFMKGARRAAGLRGRGGHFFSDPSAAKFRLNQDVPRMLEVCGRFVPTDRLHVVTVPADSSEPRLLWERFAQTIDLDPGVCPGLPPANESLGYASAELLRRVNVDLGQVALSDYNATVREYLAGRVLAFEARHEVRPKLDAATGDFGLAWNERVRTGILRSGARVVGDLEDLPTALTERHQRLIDDGQTPPTDDELLRAAAPAVEAMHALVRRRVRRARKQGVPITDDDLGGVDLGSETSSSADRADPVSAATAEIAALCRAAIVVRRRIRGSAGENGT